MSVVGVRWTRPARLERVRLGASWDGGWRAGAPVKGNSRDNIYRSPALADARWWRCASKAHSESQP